MEDTKKLEKAPEIQQEGDQEKSPDESELDPDLKELAKQLDNELDVDVTQRRGGEEIQQEVDQEKSPDESELEPKLKERLEQLEIELEVHVTQQRGGEHIQQEVDQEKSPDESELEPKLKELVEQFKNELEVHVTQQRGGEESHEIQGNKESTETTNVMTIQESEQLVAEIPCAACSYEDLTQCVENCPYNTYFSPDNIDDYKIMTGLYKRQTITEWIKQHPKSKWKEFFEYRIHEAKFSDKKRLGGTANEIHKRDRKIAKLEKDIQVLRKALQERDNAANINPFAGFPYPPPQNFLHPPPTQTPTFQIRPNLNLASTSNSQNPQNWNLASTSYSQIPPNWNLASTSNSQNNPNWNLASTSNSQNPTNWNVASSTSNSQMPPNYRPYEYMGTYIPVMPIHPIYNPYQSPFYPYQSPIYPPEFSQIPTRPTNNRTNRGFIIREPQQEETQGDERQNAEQP